MTYESFPPGEVDRPTSGTYRLELTPLGEKVCREDAERRGYIKGVGIRRDI